MHALWFLARMVSSPSVREIVDNHAYKNSALVHFLLEIKIIINKMEQCNCLLGRILSKVTGIMVTNYFIAVLSMFAVTKLWRRVIIDQKLDLILWNSVIASNLSTIVSDTVAHYLAKTIGQSTEIILMSKIIRKYFYLQ